MPQYIRMFLLIFVNNNNNNNNNNSNKRMIPIIIICDFHDVQICLIFILVRPLVLWGPKL